jgi:dihydropteroate synthase
VFRARGKELVLGRRTCVMGVINVTPDSFSDGGRFLDADRAVDLGLQMVREGAAMIDIGGESTRPGASPVPAGQELDRIAPVIEKLRPETDALISVDTTKASVARWALDHGVEMVNDISALHGDPDMSHVVSERGAGVVLMHMMGNPRTMQESPTYRDVAAEVTAFLERAVAAAETTGVAADSILVDPGFGFGKTVDHNLVLLNRLDALSRLGKPILVGTSRKSFIGKLLDLPVHERLHGTSASVAAAILRGAHAVRVHDVSQMAQVARLIDAILNETWAGNAR